MSNPLALFRKHQKILLVVFGVALMIVFTIGGIVSQSMMSAAPSANNGQAAVVKLKSNPSSSSFETLTENDLQQMRYSRQFLRQFMRTINGEAAAMGATRKQYLGVPDTADERSLLQTLILSKKAEEMGLVVTDENILNFLRRHTDQKVGDIRFSELIRQMSQGRMSDTMFLNAMRKEMLALRFQELFRQGIFPSTPAAYWDFYQRLNRQVSIEAVPFNVAQYLDRVPEPSEGEIAKAYEEYKDSYSFPSLPTPGFKERKKIEFQYAQADLTTFLDEEKTKITSEEIEAYYNANKEQFRNATLPNEDDFGIDISAPGTEVEVEETEIDTTPAPEGDSQESTSNESSESTLDDTESEAETDCGLFQEEDEATEEPATEEPATEEPATEEPVTEEPVTEEPATEEPATEEPATEEPATEEPATEEPATEEPATEEPATEEPATEEPATEEPATEEPATEEPATEEPATEEPATEEPATEEPATEEPATENEDLTDILGEDTDTTSPAEEPVAEYKSLEEVSEEIRTLLATPLASERMTAALKAVGQEMDAYNDDYIIWDVSDDRDTVPQPNPPNLRDIAAKNGLSYGSTPLVNIIEINETEPFTETPKYPISQAFTMNFEPFSRIGFSDRLRLFEPRTIPGRERDRTYLFWKSAEVPEKVPTLEECRDDVARDLKMESALTLAKKAAEEAATELKNNNQSPADAYRNSPDKNVIESGQFTWMSAPSVPYLPARISTIPGNNSTTPGIKFAGNDFMKEVFSLGKGDIGIATDAPEKTVYLVYVKSEASDLDQLKENFFRTGPSFELQNLAASEARNLLNEWYTEYEKELGVEWAREPIADTQRR